MYDVCVGSYLWMGLILKYDFGDKDTDGPVEYPRTLRLGFSGQQKSLLHCMSVEYPPYGTA